jgi:hypothetical protein
MLQKLIGVRRKEIDSLWELNFLIRTQRSQLVSSLEFAKIFSIAWRTCLNAQRIKGTNTKYVKVPGFIYPNN